MNLAIVIKYVIKMSFSPSMLQLFSHFAPPHLSHRASIKSKWYFNNYLSLCFHLARMDQTNFYNMPKMMIEDVPQGGKCGSVSIWEEKLSSANSVLFIYLRSPVSE